MKSLADHLKEQNNGLPWLDCKAAGLGHLLGPVEEVVSAYGSEEGPVNSLVRRCKRCPVSVMTVRYE